MFVLLPPLPEITGAPPLPELLLVLLPVLLPLPVLDVGRLREGPSALQANSRTDRGTREERCEIRMTPYVVEHERAQTQETAFFRGRRGGQAP
jgi:hypothetical protein